MSMADKARHKAEELKGNVKEGAGEATGDEELAADGRVDQASGRTKQAGDSLKDAARNVGDALKGDRS